MAVGLAFLLLAAGGLAALFLIPIPPPTVTDTSSTSWSAPPGASNSTVLTGESTFTGSVNVEWQSALPLTVAIYGSQGCLPGTAGCGPWHALATFTAQPSGNWSAAGTLHFPLLFAWTNPGRAAGPVLVTTTATQTGSASLSPLSEVFLGLGVGALGFVGGVALFLGLFLRGGVYRGRPPLVSRRAEDAEMIAREGPDDPPPSRPDH